MPYVVKDRVKVTSTTTGTGTFTLGAAATGFQSFGAINPTTNAWSVGVAQYSGDSFSVAAQEANPQGLFFKPDGTKMYICGQGGVDVNEYDLSTAWDITTASYVQNFSVSAKETNPYGLWFKTDGTKMYICGTSSDSVHEYDLSVAWNISTATFLQSKSVSAQDTTPLCIYISDDGIKLYVTGNVGQDINEYTLSGAWNISTASFVQSFSVAAQATAPRGVFFKTDGTKMYVVDAADNDNVNQYDLATAWNVSTASFVQSFSVASQTGTTPIGLFWKDDGAQFWVVGDTVDSVFSYVLSASTYYTITDGTDWEVGIGSVLPGGTTLSRDTILESSNSNALVNWGAGSKDVFCTYPADATEGTVPTADNSSVGTDLYAWTNLKKQLDAGVINGVPYDNNSTAGVVSTYSLVSTLAPYNYFGGVLAPNGDIHFVPNSASRGQKISSSGVVSTYSLVYTIGNAYSGGVLAPNGDIHFVPYGANRGQKINSSGVVSTYSLVYTAGYYQGGVLAPNGDIHFIPDSAPVGQKVSAAGVVSTYSLVYTSGGSYVGGVLAPNGDIHFVPNSAPRGQKISAAGVVSTYSLVYTTGAGAYNGGVIAPNGDIHFIPFSAVVGQKISAAGVVSTYSLVYTASQAYQGGVLAPNGDIHFVNHKANRGQKISPTGVVSTYSLVYTLGTGANAGGVLNTNGEIYFCNAAGVIGQKISTNTIRPIGYALSPFFNKF